MERPHLSQGPRDRPLRVALVVPYYDPRAGDDPERVLSRQPTLAGIARAEASRGIEVGAFQLFSRAAAVAEAGVNFTFVPAPTAARAAARWLHWAFPRYLPPYYEPAGRLLAAAGAWRPDVLHVFGLTLDLNLLLASRLARRRRTPMVVHYHGGLPDADPATRAVRRHNLGAADRVLFTSRDQAEPWIAAGMLRPDRVAEVLETSTPIRPIPRAQARAATGMWGDPVCVMAGRLHPVKDPVTALTGFAMLAERRPLARLYVYSLTDELRTACEALARAMPALDGRVEFRGRARPEAMPAIYSSADLLLQASRREWSGLSVLEAMACGAIPVVSDIPSLRRMTAGGTRGRLFPAGDPAALAAAAMPLAGSRRTELAEAVSRHFGDALSFDALARDLEAIYREVAVAGGRATSAGRPHGVAT